jgi:hypothetical protein
MSCTERCLANAKRLGVRAACRRLRLPDALEIRSCFLRGDSHPKAAASLRCAAEFHNATAVIHAGLGVAALIAWIAANFTKLL